VSPAVLHALLLGHIVPSGKTLHIPALLKAGAFVVTFKAPTGGKVVIAWYMVPLGARLGRARHRPKPVLVATGQLSVSAAGMVKLKVRLTAAGRTLLRHVTHVKLTATGVFTPHGHSSVSARRTFSLKR
jgi:hypothetical protein